MRDFGKLIVAKGLKNLPKVQKIAQSGHTDHYNRTYKDAIVDTTYVPMLIIFINELKLSFFNSFFNADVSLRHLVLVRAGLQLEGLHHEAAASSL